MVSAGIIEDEMKMISGLIMMMRIMLYTECHKGKMETNYVKFPDIHILNYVGNGVTGIVTIIRHRDRL